MYFKYFGMNKKYAEFAWGEFFFVRRVPLYQLLEPSRDEGCIQSL